MNVWSETYEQARDQFLERAKHKGQLFRLPVPSKIFPNDELTIDIVWIGSLKARKALLVQSGVHGVEAFAGSAIQNAFLEQTRAPDGDCAIVLVHVLNPYGMRALRRVNENNVDLNRNCVFDDFEKLKADGSAYLKLDAVLNPRSKTRDKFFWPKMVFALMRNGYASLSQAVAQGQYSIPDGIFYGGNSLQPEIIAYGAWIKNHLQSVSELVVIDLHTGLGTFAAQTVFCGSHKANERFAKLAGREDLKIAASTEAYQASGSVSSLFANVLPKSQIDFYTAEFGTYTPPQMLRAMVVENQRFKSAGETGNKKTENSGEKFCLKFIPNSSRWKESVSENGVRLVDGLLYTLREQQGD